METWLCRASSPCEPITASANRTVISPGAERAELSRGGLHMRHTFDGIIINSAWLLISSARLFICQKTLTHLHTRTHTQPQKSVHQSSHPSSRSVSQLVVYWQHCSEALEVCWGFHRAYRSIYCPAGSLLGGLGPLTANRVNRRGGLNSVSVQDWLSLSDQDTWVFTWGNYSVTEWH